MPNKKIMTNSIIIIRGNHLYNLSEVFKCFKYNDLYQDSAFNNAEEFNNYLLENYFVFANQEIALRGIWLENG